MTRPPVEIHKRQKVTMPVMLSWALRFMSCAKCDQKLTNGFEDDHIIPIANGGTNAPENRQPLCKSCHRRKTRADTKSAAKAKRLAGETGQQARLARRGESSIKSGNKLPLGRKIPSRAKGEYKPRVKDINE